MEAVEIGGGCHHHLGLEGEVAGPVPQARLLGRKVLPCGCISCLPQASPSYALSHLVPLHRAVVLWQATLLPSKTLLSSSRTAPSPEHPCFQASPSVKTMGRGTHTSFFRGLTCEAWGLGPSQPGAQTNTSSVIWGHSHPILVVGCWWAGADERLGGGPEGSQPTWAPQVGISCASKPWASSHNKHVCLFSLESLP